MNEPIRFEVTPERVGRHDDVEPFTVGLGTHRKPTKVMLAERIMKSIGGYLMRTDTTIQIDMKKGRWTLNHGRSGSGTFRVIE